MGFLRREAYVFIAFRQRGDNSVIQRLNVPMRNFTNAPMNEVLDAAPILDYKMLQWEGHLTKVRDTWCFGPKIPKETIVTPLPKTLSVIWKRRISSKYAHQWMSHHADRYLGA